MVFLSCIHINSLVDGRLCLILATDQALRRSQLPAAYRAIWSVFSTASRLSQWRRLSQQPKERYSDTFYLFAFHNVSQANILIAIFNWLFSKPNFWNFHSSTFSFTINVNKDSVEYSGVSFCYGTFYDDSLYDPCWVGPSTPDLWCITVANQASFSLLSALLALFRCVCVSSYSILVQFF
jgi:hypothetical protein